MSALYVAPNFCSIRLNDAGEHSEALALVLNMIDSVHDVLRCTIFATYKVALVVVDVEVAVISVIFDGDVHVSAFLFPSLSLGI